MNKKLMNNVVSILFSVVIISYFCILPIARSGNIKKPYEVTMLLEDQNIGTLKKAKLKAFKQMLFRRSANKDIVKIKVIQKEYTKITQYIQKIEFSTKDVSSVTLHFEPRLIDRLIKIAKQPLWDFNRPTTLLWLAYESHLKNNRVTKTIMTENAESSEYIHAIQKEAIKNAIPIIFPLMDLDDELLVSLSDVWGGFHSKIIQASERYMVPSIMRGKIFQRGSEWFGHYTHIHKKEKKDFRFKAENVSKLHAQMIEKLGEVLCQHYCITESDIKRELFVNILDIPDFKAFQKVKQFFSQLLAIKRVEILRTEKNKTTFKLELLSNTAPVIARIHLNPFLTLLNDTTKKNINNEKEDNKKTLPYLTHVIDLNKPFKKESQKKNELIQTLDYRWVQ
jgi:hypothetical protein